MLTISATTAATTSRKSSMRRFEGEREAHWESVTRINSHRSNVGAGFAVLLPNGSRLSCGRLARRRKGRGRQSVPARTQHSASFKRMLGRALVAAQSDSRDTNRQTNHTRPEREESKKAWTDGIRIGIGPQPDRSGHDDEDQRPAAKDEESEADANPAGLQILSHVVSAVRASA